MDTGGMNNGEVFVGKYRLGLTLCQGAFGKVMKAEHILSGHEVVVKILKRHKMASTGMEEKVSRVINIRRLFAHPHIIRVYQVIEKRRAFYVVMEYAQSGDLFKYVEGKHRLHEDEARKFFHQIISGVEYCLKNMVVHRDLKLENLLLDSRGNVKIAGFGLSIIMTDGHLLKTKCGTPYYAAPELFSSEPYGPEVDVWSCGVILYAMLCGTLPFVDENFANLLGKMKAGQYILPAHLSSRAKDLISKMLIADPLKRITIPEIRQHPWFKLHVPCSLVPPPDAMQKLDEEIVQQVIRMGFEKDHLLESLQNKIKNDATAAYYILLDSRGPVSNGCLGPEV